MQVIGAIIIGFIVGLLARVVSPGRSNPSGFILTTVLGIVGALVATYLGQAIHLYEPGENAGFIGAVVGAVIVLLVWRLFTRNAA
jgi:uncharacterized membrane protein YeaQ/YmgE (transglycosylase-associated protein family)